MEFKIERNIPVKEPKKQEYVWKIYPFDKLHIGDSFFIPKDGDSSLIKRIYAATNSAKHNLNIRLAVRSVTENKKDGYRIWRTA